jgi:tight adherence protein B
MSQFLTPLIYISAFLAVVIAVQAVTYFVFSSRDRDRKINRRLSLLEAGIKPEKVYSSLLRVPHGHFGDHPFLVQMQYKLATYCRRAGVDLTPGRLIAIFSGLAAFFWVVSLFVSRFTSAYDTIVHGFVSLAGSCILSALIIWVWISRRQAKQKRLLEEQLPTALDVINRAIRAGHPVVSAIQLAANEMGDPVGSEFGLIVDETTYGFEFSEALMNFARRTGSEDAHFFAVSVSVQSETGGNLAEILEGLANVIRSRNMLGKRVKALSSEGRASAILLSVLPALVVGFMLLMSPSYYTTKFSDPIFWPTVGVVAVIYLIGWWMMHRIINFKY